MGSMIRPLLAIAISILPGPVHALIIADDTILDLQEFAPLAVGELDTCVSSSLVPLFSTCLLQEKHGHPRGQW